MKLSYRHDPNNKITCTRTDEHSCNNLGCNCSEGARCCKVVTISLATGVSEASVEAMITKGERFISKATEAGFTIEQAKFLVKVCFEL